MAACQVTGHKPLAPWSATLGPSEDHPVLCGGETSRVPGCVPLTDPPAPLLSLAERVGLPMDAIGVYTSLGLNERLFVVNVQELGSLVSARVCQLPPSTCARSSLEL